MTENKENNKKKDVRHREPKNQNVRCKSNSINDNVKCEWTKQSNQKEEIIRLDLKNKNKIQLSATYRGHTLYRKKQINWK